MDRAAVRHNFVALGLDYGCFVIGMSFASQATILPAFAVHLGATNVLIGAIPAVMTLGWFLPSLFVANHTERLARKLPFVLRYTVWERVPLPALAAVAFLVAEPAPGLALAIFLALLLVMTATGGALMPAWMDIIARSIPTTLRGRFFGTANVVAGASGLVGSVLTAWYLTRFAPPRSYGVCFLTGSVFLAISYVFLASVREPAGPTPSVPVALGRYLGRMPALLGRDRNLSWFLVARGFGTVGTMANGFFTVYALRGFQAAEWQVALLTTLFLTGQMAGYVSLGWLADHAGHRLVLAIGLAAMTTANVVAASASSADALLAVLALSGLHQASMNISARTILLELAPEGERPTYIGLTNTMLAPVTFSAPLVAGLMVDRLGFPAVFACAAGVGTLGLAVLLGRVTEPRGLPRPV